MELININKRVNLAGCRVCFNYVGFGEEKVGSIEKQVEEFLNKHLSKNILENIMIIRTILKDYDEKSLAFSWKDDKGEEIVTYNDGKLLLYEKSKGEKGYTFKYGANEGLRLNYDTSRVDVEDSFKMESIYKETTELIKQIYCLGNVRAIEINTEDKILIEVYKVFYGEQPNFKDEYINIKFQTMMYILSEFGLLLNGNNDFDLLGEQKMPVSLRLEQIIYKLYPLGDFTNLEDNFKLVKKQREQILTIRDGLKEVIGNDCDQIVALGNISKILYSRKYVLPYNCDVREISDETNCTIKEVETSLKLVKSVNKRISGK